MNGETDQPTNNSPQYIEALKMLTPREVEVLEGVAAGLTSKEIADELYISYRTVQKYRQNICKKLELKGYQALYKWCTIHKNTNV